MPSSYGMKKILFLIAQNNFRDEEFKKPKAILEKAGESVCVASETTNVAVGKFGLQVMPDMGVSEAFRRVDEFKGVVVVGGGGCMALASNSYVMRLLKRAREKRKLIAAICWAPRVLAKAGVLKGLHVTASCEGTDSDIAKEICSKGAIFDDGNVVIDGRVITANGPAAASDFGEAILKKLQE